MMMGRRHSPFFVCSRRGSSLSTSFATTKTMLLLIICLGSTAVRRCLANENAESWHPSKARQKTNNNSGGGGGGGAVKDHPMRDVHKGENHRHHHQSKGEQNHGHVRKKHRVAAEASPEWKMGEEGLGTWETCDTCEQCILDDPPKDVTPFAPAPNAQGVVHCKKCLGCTVILRRMKGSQAMLGKEVKVFAGASGAAVMKGVTASHGNVFVKAWCGLKGGYKQTPLHATIPEQCTHDGPTVKDPSCKDRGGIFGWSECNFKFLNALNKLAEDANLSAATPRTWTEEMRSFLPMHTDDPASGVKVDTKGQFYEVADGVSIEAFYESGITRRSMALTRSIPHDDVVRAATFDLLFSEQDRHGQNVFVSESGRLTVLDNEGSFGPINSMLLPGGQKFEVYRIGYNAVCCGNLPGPDEQNCPGALATASAPEVFVDYRCHARGRLLGTNLPPGVEPFLRRVDKMDAKTVYDHYGMSHPSHAAVLKQRVADMLDGGFERALIAAYSRQPRGRTYGNNFSYALQPACCAVEESHCKVRIPGKDMVEMQGMPEEEKQVWPGNQPGPEAKRLWPEMAPAPHLFSATHGRRLYTYLYEKSRRRLLLRKQ